MRAMSRQPICPEDVMRPLDASRKLRRKRCGTTILDQSSIIAGFPGCK